MLKKLLLESKILDFLAKFNTKLVGYFYKSITYKIFLKINIFFKRIILQNTNNSYFINALKSSKKRFSIKDIGLFIILVLVFNSLMMFIAGREIDIFSVIARIFFLSLGLFLILKKQKYRI